MIIKVSFHITNINTNCNYFNLVMKKAKVRKLKESLCDVSCPPQCLHNTSLTTSCRGPRAAAVVSHPPQRCSLDTCKAGGTCEDHDGTFTCHCKEGRSGTFCQEKLGETTFTEAGFMGTSYTSLQLTTYSVTRTSIELSFRTYKKEGLLLLATQREDNKGDFLSIRLHGGFVSVEYDLGSGTSVLVSSAAVTLGTWHRLVFKRYHQDGMLQIDKSPPVRGRSPGRNKSLNIQGDIHIGGHPHTSAGLMGCVRKLKIGRKSVGWRNGQDGVGVIPCFDHPCGKGFCRNEGQCELSEDREKPVCSCSNGFRGQRCGKKKRKRRKQRKYWKNRARHKMKQKFNVTAKKRNLKVLYQYY